VGVSGPQSIQNPHHALRVLAAAKVKGLPDPCPFGFGYMVKVTRRKPDQLSLSNRPPERKNWQFARNTSGLEPDSTPVSTSFEGLRLVNQIPNPNA